MAALLPWRRAFELLSRNRGNVFTRGFAINRRKINKTLNVIFVEDVEGAGFKGELINLKRGHARQLIHERKAVYASEFNRERYIVEITQEELKRREERRTVALLQKQLSKIKVEYVFKPIVAKSGETLSRFKKGISLFDIQKYLNKQYNMDVPISYLKLPAALEKESTEAAEEVEKPNRAQEVEKEVEQPKGQEEETLSEKEVTSSGESAMSNFLDSVKDTRASVEETSQHSAMSNFLDSIQETSASVEEKSDRKVSSEAVSSRGNDNDDEAVVYDPQIRDGKIYGFGEFEITIKVAEFELPIRLSVKKRESEIEELEDPSAEAESSRKEEKLSTPIKF
mmetsp:Transcript_906/g.1245  ORF Transcript_906/g.1245 Transcript_906/m.1245 type:complete len:339 (-) Transcript_906:95-1111(-)